MNWDEHEMCDRMIKDLHTKITKLEEENKKLKDKLEITEISLEILANVSVLKNRG